MNELYKILFGIIILFFGFIIGDIIRKQTMDEQKIGKKWFKLIVGISLFLTFFGLVSNKDWMLFTFSFFAIVTSRSLKK